MKKKIGIGSIALVLSVICIFLSITFKESGVNYGDKLFEFIGLKTWSNGTTGTHYTIFYLLPFYILSIYLGYKFADSFGAKIGRRISIFFVVLIIISLPFMAISFTPVINQPNKIDNLQESCDPNGNNVITGEIKEINNRNYRTEDSKGTILINIISGLDSEDDIVFYHNSNTEFKIGQKVRITHNGNINESNPPQASAECIEIIK